MNSYKTAITAKRVCGLKKGTPVHVWYAFDAFNAKTGKTEAIYMIGTSTGWLGHVYANTLVNFA